MPPEAYPNGASPSVWPGLNTQGSPDSSRVQKRRNPLEPCLRRPVVAVMQAVDLRNLDDASGGAWRDWA